MTFSELASNRLGTGLFLSLFFFRIKYKQYLTKKEKKKESNIKKEEKKEIYKERKEEVVRVNSFFWFFSFLLGE